MCEVILKRFEHFRRVVVSFVEIMMCIYIYSIKDMYVCLLNSLESSALNYITILEKQVYLGQLTSKIHKPELFCWAFSGFIPLTNWTTINHHLVGEFPHPSGLNKPRDDTSPTMAIRRGASHQVLVASKINHTDHSGKGSDPSDWNLQPGFGISLICRFISLYISLQPPTKTQRERPCYFVQPILLGLRLVALLFVG